ncbi:MAG TPA: hypothetical protein VEK07_05730 [Polyangiaceae bacterium]|nr:hypothetical protein [Polyangiaceae bacterium]
MIESPPPVYVERVDFSIVPPALLADATLYLFPIPSDIVNQQHLCETILNIPSEGACDFRAVQPFVLLIFARYEKVQKINTPESNYSYPPQPNDGYARFHAAGVSVLIAPSLPKSDEPQIILFPYCTFVDHGASIAGTRELQGWSTETAEIQIADDDPSKGFTFVLTCPAIKRFGPHSIARPERLIHVRNVPEAARGKQVGSPLRHHLSEMWTRALASENQRPLRLALISLKQFPDVAHPARACYQAGVQTIAESFRNEDHRWVALPGKFALEIETADSHPLVAQLGLDVEQFSGLDGFCLRSAQLRVNAGKELWRAP